MAVGFPVKADYATGDVLTAAQMNDLSGTLNTVIAPLGSAAGKNTVINGGMDIWQRGTSIAGTTTSFSADRWQSYRSVAGSTFSRQTGPEAIQYCVRVQRDSGNSSTTGIFLSQNFETVNSIPLAGKTVTLSFYARKGADYSRASSGLTVNLYTGTGTDQNGLTGAYTGSVTAISQTATLTTSWQRFTYSATLGSTATEINITYGFTPVGTAGAADYYEISGVQLEASSGSVATPFARTGGTIQGELAACQRYYQKSYDIGTALATATTTGAISGKVVSNTVVNEEQYGNTFLRVPMRTNPTVTIYGFNGGTGVVSNPASGADLAANSGTATWIGQNSFVVFNNSGGSVTTSRFSVLYHYQASAEL